MRKKTAVEITRARIWVAQVRQYSQGVSNYQLDRLFSDEKGVNSAERRAEFSKIENEAKRPRPGVRKRVWRAYPGIHLLDRALLWKLLGQAVSIDECNAQVDHLMARYRLVRVEEDVAARALAFPVAVSPTHYSLFKSGLGKSMENWPWYTRVSFLLALNMQANAAKNHRVGEVVQGRLDDVIDASMSTLFSKTADYLTNYQDLLGLCIGAQVSTHDEPGQTMRAVANTRIERIILPAELVNEMDLVGQKVTTTFM